MSIKLTQHISKARYGQLTVFENDTGAVTQSLLQYGEWAENEISFLRQFVEPGSSVLDVGAYIGTHSLAFASFVGASGRVIAFEAQPEAFALLKSNAPLKTVELHNAAVSSRAGEIEIPIVDTGEQSSFGSMSLAAARTQTILSDRTVTIPAITIDSLNLASCALMKIDVEGMEDLVLQGSMETLKTCQPIVYCECNTLAAGLKSIAVLRSAGYEVLAHVVDAFNADNFLGNTKNIFADAREVAIVGFPKKRAHQFASIHARAVELLLPMEDADDLALALLNKPQYQVEVLEISRASGAGGKKFLEELIFKKVEVARLQEEVVRLRGIELASREKQDEITRLNGHLEHRDADIRMLQEELTARNLESADLHSRFDDHVQAKQTEISELNTHLASRDNAIWKLQQELAARNQELSEVHSHLRARDESIVRLQEKANQSGRAAAAKSAISSKEVRNHESS